MVRATLCLRMGVAACCFAVRAAAVVHLDSCPLQNLCNEWFMEPMTTGCKADHGSTSTGGSCPEMWQVCMKVHRRHERLFGTCPHIMVKAACPNSDCPTSAAPAPKFVMGEPIILPHLYCQFGRPGQTLLFFLEEGTGCEAKKSTASIETVHVGDSWCQAWVQCHAATPDDHACKTEYTPCVHKFKIPSACGCGEATRASVTPRPKGVAPDPSAPSARWAPPAADVWSTFVPLITAFFLVFVAATVVVIYRRLTAGPVREVKPCRTSFSPPIGRGL